MRAAFIACSLLAALHSTARAETLEPVLPVVTTLEANGKSFTALEGWRLAPADWSAKRFVRRGDGYQTAVIQNTKLPELEAITDPGRFEEALHLTLAQEGVRDVRLIERRELSGEIADVLRDVISAPDADFFVWIAGGKGPSGKMQAAGVSIVTALAEEPGTSMEYFLASEAEYAHLGGVIVPIAHLFEHTFAEPDADVLEFGQQPDDEAIEIFKAQFEEWIVGIAMVRASIGMLQQSTVSILEGLNQVEPYGLQDPIFDH